MPLPSMLSAQQITALTQAGHAIGGHGITHHPFTRLDDVELELRSATKAMAPLLGTQPLDAMAFPHGAYDAAIVAKCRTAGYRFLYCSDELLNRPRDLVSGQLPLGRINIYEQYIAPGYGKFQPALLANLLFRCPFRRTAGTRYLGSPSASATRGNLSVENS